MPRGVLDEKRTSIGPMWHMHADVAQGNIIFEIFFSLMAKISLAKHFSPLEREYRKIPPIPNRGLKDCMVVEP